MCRTLPRLTLITLTLIAQGVFTNAHAATFTVTNTNDSGSGTLRQAILDANANVDDDLIAFNIPTSDPGFQPTTQHWRIDVSSAALPAVSNNLAIDGYSQPGASVNTNTPAQGGSNARLKIELRNSTGTSVTGLDGLSNNFSALMAVRGLAINGFTSEIQLYGSSAQSVEGCFLGTTIDGTQAASTANVNRIGVRIQGPGPYRIGGLTPDTRNVISGDSIGIAFLSASNGARIEGNLIGTNAAGTVGISPRATGISTGSYQNLKIGGTDVNARNVISGNGFWGIYVDAGTFASAQVLGNFIGTDWRGSNPVPNGLNPLSPSQTVANVQLFGTTCPIQFGGALPGEANLIAFGDVAGVTVDRCTNAVQHNRYFGNFGPAIDNVFGGGAIGATPNDAGDPDSGGNRLQNYPVFDLPPSFLGSGGNSVNLSYLVDSSIANASYPITVEFYRAACGGGGSGVLLGSDTYTAANASMTKSFLLLAADGANVLPLVAVAVDASGNVSEFAPMQGDVIFRSDFENVLAPPGRGSCR